MNIMRLMLSLVFLYFGIHNISDVFNFVFFEAHVNSIYKSGLLNICSSVAGIFIGLYIFIYALLKMANINVRFMDSKLSIVFCVVLGGVFGVILNIMTLSAIDSRGFEKCDGLSKTSLRYSRKIYTKNIIVCEQLIEEKHGKIRKQ